MADSTISALTAIVTTNTGDLLPVVDINDNTMSVNGTDKKMTFAQFLTFIGNNVAGNIPGPRPFTLVTGLGGTSITNGTNIPGTYPICSFNGTFSRWDCSIPAATQPNGAALVFDVYKSSNQGTSWTSIWATNTSNRPTIAANTNVGGNTAFDTTTFNAGDWLRFDVVNAGGGACLNACLVVSTRMGQ